MAIDRFLALEAEPVDPFGAFMRGQQIGQQRKAGQQNLERNRLLQDIDAEKLSQLKEDRARETRGLEKASSLKFSRVLDGAFKGGEFKTEQEQQKFYTAWRTALIKENPNATDVPETLTPQFVQQVGMSVAAA